MQKIDLKERKRIATLSMLEDLKEQKEQLAASFLKLKKLEKIKITFLSMISHELKSPLTPILAETKLLLDNPEKNLTNDQKNMLETILRNTKILNNLISDIFDISKLQVGKLVLRIKLEDIDNVINEIINDSKFNLKLKNLKLVYEKTELPKIPIDKGRIVQVLRNLINNSIKFSNKGKSIKIQTWKDDDFIYVKVSDEGAGISQNNIKKLFQPFSQVTPSYNIKEKGSGLGLAICKGIIEQHRGKILIESKGLGKGTSIKFTLPIKKKLKRIQ